MDEAMMARCEELAAEAFAAGDAAVGCVVACGEVVIGEAHEAIRGPRDVAGHAELLAVRAACRTLRTMDLTGCTLYTTSEPCWMCSFAIRECLISEVVIRSEVEDIGGVTSPFPILTADVPGWAAPPVVRWLDDTTAPAPAGSFVQ